MVAPEQAKLILAQVDEEHHFRLHLGTDLGSLKNLAEAMDIISNDSFSHHVTKEKNDFAQWVNDVIGDKELAKGMYKVKSKKRMLKTLNKRIVFLERKAAELQFPSVLYLKRGMVDFSLGAIIGLVIGIIITVLY
jgi:hypothetical protein